MGRASSCGLKGISIRIREMARGEWGREGEIKSWAIEVHMEVDVSQWKCLVNLHACTDGVLRWTVYGFYSFGNKIEENCTRCPVYHRVQEDHRIIDFKQTIGASRCRNKTCMLRLCMLCYAVHF